MAGARRVVSAILFSPRGGSSHVVRALTTRLPAEGWRVSLVAGSRAVSGPAEDARSFYAGAPELLTVDYSTALAVPDPMFPPGGAAPLHPSFEDRPGAPDRVFAALGDAAFHRQVRVWGDALRRAGAAHADVLHLHHLTPLNAAAARVAPGVPVVAHLHGTELLMLEAIDVGAWAGLPDTGRWAERLREWAGAAQRLVVATPGGRERAAALLGVAEERIAVVPNGVDAVRFSPGPADRAATWRKVLLDRPQGWRPGGAPGSWRAQPGDVAALAEDVVLLYVGRFTAVKRLPLLVEAFARTRTRMGGGISLVIVGGHPGEWEGEHPADAVDRVSAEGVLLAGWHAQGSLPELLRASDVVVLPSVNESFGQVLVEGMACELPAIAVNRGGPGEIVEAGRTGWLVPADDGAALEDAILDAATRPAERARRGRAARARVIERYTWEAAARELADVFDAAAREGRVPGHGPRQRAGARLAR